MIPIQNNLSTEINDRQEVTASPEEQQTAQKAVPIEVKWNLPAWMLRHPGPRIEVEDDNTDWR